MQGLEINFNSKSWLIMSAVCMIPQYSWSCRESWVTAKVSWCYSYQIWLSVTSNCTYSTDLFLKSSLSFQYWHEWLARTFVNVVFISNRICDCKVTVCTINLLYTFKRISLNDENLSFILLCTLYRCDIYFISIYIQRCNANSWTSRCSSNNRSGRNSSDTTTTKNLKWTWISLYMFR